MRGFTLITLILSVIITIPSQAQNIKNFRYNLDGNKIKITYDLEGVPSDQYLITLFSSADNFTNPLRYVEGDVGEEVNPGEGKMIIWDARREFMEFKGAISLKLKYKKIPYLEFTNIELGTKFKRGRAHNIRWDDGPETLYATVELYKNNKYVQETNLERSGIEWILKIPRKQAPGIYKLKTEIDSRIAYSPEFRIARRTPTYAIIISLVGVGILTYLWISNLEEDQEIIPEPVGPNFQ